MGSSRRTALVAAPRFALPDQAEIMHWIPGRVRFRHPALRDPQGRIEIASQVASQPGVRSVRINPRLGCLVFTYETGPSEHDSTRPVRASGFSLLDLVFAFVDIPITDTLLEIREAIRFGAAALAVMRRRHNGVSAHGVLAYGALLLVHTSLLDALLPGHLRTIVKTIRSMASLVRKLRKCAAHFSMKSSGTFLSSAA